jgi:hypothetical protein
MVIIGLSLRGSYETHTSSISYSVVFDTIPYIKDGDGDLIIPNTISKARVVYSAQYSASDGNAGIYNEFGSTSGVLTQTDTLNLRISRHLLNRVASSTSSSDNFIFYINNVLHFLKANNTLTDAYLQICDIVGNRKFYPIHPTNPNIRLSLPPGCYFARLGTEVAKFVVTP